MKFFCEGYDKKVRFKTMSDIHINIGRNFFKEVELKIRKNKVFPFFMKIPVPKNELQTPKFKFTSLKLKFRV